MIYQGSLGPFKKDKMDAELDQKREFHFMMRRLHLGTDSSPWAQNDNSAVISKSLAGIHPEKAGIDSRLLMSGMTMIKDGFRTRSAKGI